MMPEERKRIIQAGLEKFSFTKPTKKSPEDLLVEKAMDITKAVRSHIHPILASGGWKDRPAMTDLITRLYLEAFNKALSKDELVSLCTMLHTQIMLESIEANPYDSSSGPDALSGV